MPVKYQNGVRELVLGVRAWEADMWRGLLEANAATHLAGLRKVRILVEVPTTPWTKFKDLTDLRITSSTSLPTLQEALISIEYRSAENKEKRYQKEDVDKLFATLAEGLR